MRAFARVSRNPFVARFLIGCWRSAHNQTRTINIATERGLCCLEFDVDSVEKATAVLKSQGCRMLVKARKQPWGQVVSRFISPEGPVIGITFTPMMWEGK